MHLTLGTARRACAQPKQFLVVELVVDWRSRVETLSRRLCLERVYPVKITQDAPQTFGGFFVYHSHNMSILAPRHIKAMNKKVPFDWENVPYQTLLWKGINIL